MIELLVRMKTITAAVCEMVGVLKGYELNALEMRIACKSLSEAVDKLFESKVEEMIKEGYGAE